MPRSPTPPPADPPAVAAPSKPSKLQMADIARLANVSISTVSRALSNHPRLSAETRERIHELARSLNYSINAGAQIMRGKSMQTVAVAFPYHAAERRHFKDPFFLALVGSIGDALIDAGYSMLILGVESEQVARLAQPHDTGQAIGTIVLGQEGYHRELNALAVRGMPFVVWGARLRDQLYCSVGSDNTLGGRQATEHLIDCGARRIAFLGDPALPEPALRHQGYLDALQARGIAPDPQLVRRIGFSAAEVREEIRRMVTEGPGFDAVFACSDLMALAAMAELADHGRRVPDDVQVVGFDDIDRAALAQPPLTSVQQAIETAGQTLVGQLLEMAAGRSPESVVLPTRLVVRGSTRAGTPAPPATSSGR